MIKEENIYIIPLRFLVGLGLVNILVKFETKIIFTLETNLYKLLESETKVDNIGDPDNEILWWNAALYI